MYTYVYVCAFVHVWSWCVFAMQCVMQWMHHSVCIAVHGLQNMHRSTCAAVYTIWLADAAWLQGIIGQLAMGLELHGYAWVSQLPAQPSFLVAATTSSPPRYSSTPVVVKMLVLTCMVHAGGPPSSRVGSLRACWLSCSAWILRPLQWTLSCGLP